VLFLRNCITTFIVIMVKAFMINYGLFSQAGLRLSQEDLHYDIQVAF